MRTRRTAAVATRWESAGAIVEQDLAAREIDVRLFGWDDVAEPDDVDGPERMARTAVSHIDPADVVIRYMHDTEATGRGRRIYDDGIGPVMTFGVSRTTRGNDLLVAAADGLAPGASIEFYPDRYHRAAGGVLVHDRIGLYAVATVDPSLETPAYPSAQVLAVRTVRKADAMDPDELEDQETPDEETDEEPDGDADASTDGDEGDEGDAGGGSGSRPHQHGAQRSLARLESRVAALETRSPRRGSRRRVDPLRLFHAHLRAMVLDDRAPLRRALADVTGTLGGTGDASGLVPETWWAGGLIELADSRPAWAAAGRIEYPGGGGIAWPRIVQHTLVGNVAQKAEVPSRALVVDTQHAAPHYAKGAVDVAMELIDQSNPQVLEVVWRDLVNQYIGYTETHWITVVEGDDDVVHGPTLPDPSTGYKAFRQALRAANKQVKAATGRPASALALDETNFSMVADATTTDGEPLFPTLGPSNRDATTTIATGESVDLGGIIAFEADVAAPILYNTTSIVNAERGPARVQVNNVAEMGVDVGIIGPVYVIVHAPAGVVILDGTAPEGVAAKAAAGKK